MLATEIVIARPMLRSTGNTDQVLVQYGMHSVLMWLGLLTSQAVMKEPTCQHFILFSTGLCSCPAAAQESSIILMGSL
jgi:hypothetical protein